MDIRRGSLERGFKWEWGRRKWWFSLISPAISSEPSDLRPHLLYYAIMLLSLMTLQWHRNRLPWMAILHENLLWARQLMSWRFWLSDKTVQKFAEIHIDCQRQKCSPHCTGGRVIRWCSPKRKRQTSKLYSRDGKEPSLFGFGSVRVLWLPGFGSVRVLIKFVNVWF